MSEHTDQEYLGDGVYASFDGYHIVLAANHHENAVISLEPEVLDALLAYRERIIKKYEEDSDE